MLYEGGNLRYLSSGSFEIIRMIYFAVRDRDWLTISPAISAEKIRKTGKGFDIKYTAHYRYDNIDFEAVISISSPRANRLIIEMNGMANSTFMKNRIGFCILHPITDCAGHECEIIHPDGSSTRGTFPEDIAPRQPFISIREMRWKINESLKARLCFEGDVFETEDQRNWTDASYKTYSTPLDQPYPVEIEKGTKLFQRVEFSLEGENPVKGERAHREPKSAVLFNIGKTVSGELPEIGVSMSSRPQPLTDLEAGILKNIPFSHIRGDLHLFSNQLEKQYDILYGELMKTGFPAEICLFFGNDPQAELAKFLLLYFNSPVSVKRFIVLAGNAHVPANNLLSLVIPAIRRAFPGIPAGTGTNSNFAQLNRSRTDFKDIDFIAFAIHPQEHASDDRTLVENTAAQQYAVQSALKFEINKPVVVSPVTLQRRFNANRDTYEVQRDDKEISPGIDPRHKTLFGAAWTVGSLKYLFDSDLKSITYYESAGERGLFMGDFGSRWPGEFDADKNMIFPVFHIFRMLMNKGRSRVSGSYSTNPLVIEGFTVAGEKSGLLFLSNLTGQIQKVMLAGIEEFCIIMKMNAGNAGEYNRDARFPSSKNHVQMVSASKAYTMKPYETLILEYGL
jgi:hypothetical protein